MPLGISFTCVTVACFTAYVCFASYNVVEFIVPGGLFGYSLTDPDTGALVPTHRPHWKEDQLLDVRVFLSARKSLSVADATRAGKKAGGGEGVYELLRRDKVGFGWAALGEGGAKVETNLTRAMVGDKLWGKLMKGKAHIHAFVSHSGVSPDASGPNHDQLRALVVRAPATKKAIRRRELRAPR